MPPGPTVGDNDNTALYGNRSLRQLAKAGKIPLAMLEGGGDDRSLRRSSPGDGDAAPGQRQPEGNRKQHSGSNRGTTVQRSSATRQSALGSGPIFVSPGQQKPKRQQQHERRCAKPLSSARQWRGRKRRQRRSIVLSTTVLAEVRDKNHSRSDCVN